MQLPLESEMRVEETLVIPATLIVSITAYCTNYNECIHKGWDFRDDCTEFFFPFSCIQGIPCRPNTET